MGKFALYLVFALAFASCYFLYKNTRTDESMVSVMHATRGVPYYKTEDLDDKDPPVNFDLVDPECAPEDKLARILYGYHIMLDTKDHVPDYVGNTVSCNCCHFNAGNTLGGKNRGISLVGVAAAYPRFSIRDNKDITLVDRIDNCFKRSENGKPLPHDSLEMESLMAYLAWISHEVMDAPKLPWLGLDPLDSKHIPDAKAGDTVYYDHCALCHGNDGEGSSMAPPLWGDNSYNDGAGMNTQTMLSSFVWQNMPHGQPVLTQEQALDVAAFLISKPRPHFIKDSIKTEEKK